MRGALRRLRDSEQGIALPVAMLITVIALGFAAVPIMASVNSQSGGSRNQGANQALAAAEAGAEIAILRQSKLLSEEPGAACVESGSVVESWCPEVGPTKIGAAEYQYQLRPCYMDTLTGACDGATGSTACTEGGESPVQVVSTGSAQVGGRPVYKRVEVTACAADGTLVDPRQTELEEKSTEQKTLEETIEYEEETGESVEIIPGQTEYEEEELEVPPPDVFAHGQIVGVESLDMSNNAQVFNGGAGSNGWVKMVGSANVCGSVNYGTEFKTDGSSSKSAPSGCGAGRTVTQGTSEYPAVAPPSNISDNNSNGTLVNGGNVSWNLSNRSLQINYGSLTLNGDKPYWLCRLVLAGGSKLYAGSGKHIRIFFDDPNHCPGINGAAQFVFANGTYIYPDAGGGPGLYFVGSEEGVESKIELAGGANATQFAIYAPHSTIRADNGIKISGAVIGRTLTLAGGAEINRSGPFTPPDPTEFLEGGTETVAIPHEGESKTVETETYKEHKKELETVTEEIEELEEELPDNPPPPAAASLDRNSFVECTAEPPEAAPDSGC